MLKRKAIDWQAVRARLDQGEARLDQERAHRPEVMVPILRQRAAWLARRTSQAREQDAATLALTFSLGEERYGILLAELAEICTLEQFTPVPGPDPGLKGVLNWHGRVLSVLDLPALLGQPEPAVGGAVLILRRRESGCGLWVPSRLDMLPVDPDTLTQAPGRWLLGLTPARVQLLDLPALLLSNYPTNETGDTPSTTHD